MFSMVARFYPSARSLEIAAGVQDEMDLTAPHHESAGAESGGTVAGERQDRIVGAVLCGCEIDRAGARERSVARKQRHISVSARVDDRQVERQRPGCQ